MQLTIALQSTRRGMRKRDIKASVTGYDPEAPAEAFDRMFERDKSQLRQLGFDIVTLGVDGHGEDVRYRIEAPEEPDYTAWFTPAQLTVLGIAARRWHSAAPQRDITTALIRLRALGLDVTPDPEALGTALLPTEVALHAARADALDVLTEALASRRRVTFTYRAAWHGQVSKRTVEPWRLAVRPTGWYLIGEDTEKHEGRVFHLNRIDGAVKVIGREGAYELPDGARIDATASLLDRGATQVAVLEVDQGRAQALRARATAVEVGADGTDTVRIAFSHPAQFAREIVRYGPAVVAREPAALVERVIELLRAADSDIGDVRATELGGAEPGAAQSIPAESNAASRGAEDR